MQRAWVVLLVGCGFNASSGDGTGSMAAPGMDAAVTDSLAASPTCWAYKDSEFGVDWAACMTGVLPDTVIDITQDTSIDTSAGSSSSPGLSCVVISARVKITGGFEQDEVCALIGSSIKIEVGKTLSASGRRPLALFASKVNIDGTLDVASHSTGPLAGHRGAGSGTSGCNSNTPATKGGGGAGGSYITAGGKGGDQGGQPSSGEQSIGTLSLQILGGGCDGRRGGDSSLSGGPDSAGGAGGGGVWISSDILTLTAKAVINASGAGGLGTTADGHGGSGGGSGGLIVIHATTVTPASGAQVFAYGGGGGGGAGNGQAGVSGGDPVDDKSGGMGGRGGMAGDGGSGTMGSDSSRVDGKPGDGGAEAGGGGGGGGGGAVRGLPSK